MNEHHQRVIFIPSFLIWLILMFHQVSVIHGLTQQQRDEIVAVHNWLRQSVVPQAANMRKISYDTQKEAEAEEFTKKCMFEHSAGAYGENLQVGGHDNFTRIIMDWFQERVYWNHSAPDDKKCLKENAPPGEDIMKASWTCGHYKPTVVAKQSKVWCGSTLCKEIKDKKGPVTTDSYLNMCRYEFGSSIYMYEEGTPCSGCPMKAPFCERGLCVEKCSASTPCSCQMTCKRCGKLNPSSCICMCDLYGDPGKSDCSGESPVGENPNCTVCEGSQYGSCLNGGKDVSSRDPGSSCLCQCQNGYSGRRCEKSGQELKDIERGVKITFMNERRGNGVLFPVDYYSFVDSWNKTIKSVVFQSASQYCQSNNECGSEEKKSLMDIGNMQIGVGYPLLLPSGLLDVVIFIREPASGNYLKSKFLMSALNSSSSNMTQELRKLGLPLDVTEIVAVNPNEVYSINITTPSNLNFTNAALKRNYLKQCSISALCAAVIVKMGNWI